jgi:ketol-acid reductoisomerase
VWFVPILIARVEVHMKPSEQIAVLGYGSQGRAIALNLHDSGRTVMVGLRRGSSSLGQARRDGVRAVSMIRAVQDADMIVVAVPDHCHPAVLTPPFFARMHRRPSLVFLHGSSIHFGLVDPPPEFPVLLLAPHAPGLAVRENFLRKKPYSAFYAVHRGPKRQGHSTLVDLAQAIGITKTHLIKTTFADEAIGDLFGEQAVLCGGLARLLKFGFETLVEAGLPPENAYLEVAYQIDLIVALIRQHGLAGMLDRISPMARYGSIVNGPRVISRRVKADMEQVYAEIASGAFVRKAEQAGFTTAPEQVRRVTSDLFDRQVRKFKGSA